MMLECARPRSELYRVCSEYPHHPRVLVYPRFPSLLLSSRSFPWLAPSQFAERVHDPVSQGLPPPPPSIQFVQALVRPRSAGHHYLVQHATAFFYAPAEANPRHSSARHRQGPSRPEAGPAGLQIRTPRTPLRSARVQEAQAMPMRVELRRGTVEVARSPILPMMSMREEIQNFYCAVLAMTTR